MPIKNLTLKIQGQSHGWGQSFKSQFGPNIWLTHILLVPCQSTPLFLPMIELFKNFTFKIQCQSYSSRSHSRCNILATCIPFVPCWSSHPFLRCSYLKNWPWKSKVKVMGEVKVQSHNVSVTSYQLTSFWFHVNRPSHSWDTAFSKFHLQNPGSRPNDHDVAQLQI